LRSFFSSDSKNSTSRLKTFRRITKEIKRVMIKEHNTRNTNICIDGCSFIDRNEIEKNPQIIEDAAPAMK
jgi:hypothetical protein